MKDIIVVGAGGFGREVIWLIERINTVNIIWNILGFVDDDFELSNKSVDDYKILGTTKWLKNYSEDVYVVCAIAVPNIRKRIVNELSFNHNIRYATLIDPSVIISKRVTIGDGSIICAGAIVSVNIKMGNHVIVDLDCTIGHDAVINDFVTLYPSVNISGNVLINEDIEIGTGTQIIQGIEIKANVVVGAGAVVVKDVLNSGIYVGIPARLL